MDPLNALEPGRPTAPGELEKRIERQVEAAYDYRGMVTVKFKDGRSLEGYLFNREFKNPKLKEDYFIDLFQKGSGERKRCSIGDLETVIPSGEDCAAAAPGDTLLNSTELSGVSPDTAGTR